MKRKPIAIAFVAAGFLFLFLSRVIAAETLITRFVFITDPQTISAGVISDALTVQAQDQGGNSHKSEETIDLVFSSTSSTGVFLNASGGPVDPVMNKNTANRTFYYRDITRGTHTMTVKVTGRISGKSWAASQSVSIETSAPQSASSSAPPPVSYSVAASTTPSGASSYRAPVAPLPPTPTITAFAGEDRVALVGVEENFIGGAIGLVREPITNARFWWNFGDGMTLEGRSVGHIYREPGAYTAVLHVSSGEYAASDYAAVNVIPNKIAVAQVISGEGGAIHIANPSPVGADIGGWILEDEKGKKFSFPVRTIIGAQSEVAFANSVTGLSPDSKVILRYSGGLSAAEWDRGAGQGSIKPMGVNSSASGSSLASLASGATAAGMPSRALNTRLAAVPQEAAATASLAEDVSSDLPAAETAPTPTGKRLGYFPGGFFTAAFALSAFVAAGFFLVRRIF